MEDSNEPFSLSLLLKKAGITEELKLKKLEFFLNYSEVTENTLSQVTKEELEKWESKFKAELREDESLKKEFYEFVGKEVRFVLGATAGAIAKAASEWGKKENSNSWESLINLSYSKYKILPPSDYIFCNREEDIESIIGCCVKNLVLRSLPSTEQGNWKPTLITLPQMFGSGKTTLASYFIDQIQSSSKFDEKLSQIIEQNCDQLKFSFEQKKKIFEKIKTKSIVIPVDSRLFGNLSSYDYTIFLRGSILSVLLTIFPDDVEYWKNRSTKISLGEILNFFGNKYDKFLFVLLDEFDYYRNSYPSIQSDNDEIIAKRYYDIWRLLDVALRQCDCTFICCGRSSILFSIDRGIYPKLISPGVSYCILLKPLKLCHVEEWLKKEKFQNVENLASLIIKKTAGIPRLVYYSISYLKYLKSNNIFTNDLFEESFHSYLRSEKQAEPEIKPWLSFSQQQLVMYTEFIRWSIFQIPLNKSTQVSSYLLNLNQKDNKNEKKITLLELCSLYNLYVSPLPNYEDLFVVIFPSLLLEILTKEQQSQFSPLVNKWIFASQNIAFECSTEGQLLESLGRIGLLARLREQLQAEKNQTMSQKFPFLEGTLLAGKICPSTILCKRWPTMVQAKGSGGAKPVEEMTEEKKKEWKAKIEAYFNGSSNSVHVNILDWEKLFPYMQKDTLYFPESMSSSSDLFLSLDNSILAFQWKNVDKFTMQQLVAEINKSILGCPKNYLFTLVVASRAINDDITSNKEAKQIIWKGLDNSEKCLAYYFKNNSNIIYGYNLSENVDVVVLTTEGLTMLLGEQNMMLIQNNNFEKYLNFSRNQLLRDLDLFTMK